MGKHSINFAEVEGSFQPLPEGQYQVVVERVEVRESKSSDNDYFNWELKVMDEEYEDQRLWMITSLSPKAMFRLKDVFVALGVIEGDEEDFELDWDDDVDVTPKEGPLVTEPELEGLTATAVVRNETYEGKERNKVDELLPPESDAKPKKASGAKKSGAKKTRTRSLR